MKRLGGEPTFRNLPKSAPWIMAMPFSLAKLVKGIASDQRNLKEPGKKR